MYSLCQESKMSLIFYRLFLLSVIIFEASGHGYMLSPINRASRWRRDPTNWAIPHDYEDNQFFCGGFSVQYNINGGKCGPCGDDWRDTVPRSNENGGIYGNGIVVAHYFSGSIIKVDVRITANHRGKISYQLCQLEDPNLSETEDCFTYLKFNNDEYFQEIGSTDFNVTSYVKLPDDFICDRCVLRWHYTAGNNWGQCDNGTSAVGCGPQETFRSCSDIRILPRIWFRLFGI